MVHGTAEYEVGSDVPECHQTVGDYFEVGHGSCDDFEQETVLACEMVCLDSAGRYWVPLA